MLTSRLDHWLTRLSARWHGPPADTALPTRRFAALVLARVATAPPS